MRSVLRKCSKRVIRSCNIQYNDQKMKNNYNYIYKTYIEESIENCIIVEMFYNTDWQIKLNCYWNFLYLVNMFYNCQKFLMLIVMFGHMWQPDYDGYVNFKCKLEWDMTLCGDNWLYEEASLKKSGSSLLNSARKQWCQCLRNIKIKFKCKKRIFPFNRYALNFHGI